MTTLEQKISVASLTKNFETVQPSKPVMSQPDAPKQTTVVTTKVKNATPKILAPLSDMEFDSVINAFKVYDTLKNEEHKSEARRLFKEEIVRGGVLDMDY